MEERVKEIDRVNTGREKLHLQKKMKETEVEAAVGWNRERGRDGEWGRERRRWKEEA